MKNKNLYSLCNLDDDIENEFLFNNILWDDKTKAFFFNFNSLANHANSKTRLISIIATGIEEAVDEKVHRPKNQKVLEQLL